MSSRYRCTTDALRYCTGISPHRVRLGSDTVGHSHDRGTLLLTALSSGREGTPVRIRIDYDRSDWKEKALRCLSVGAVLVDVPEDRIETLVSGAEAQGTDFRVEESARGYRIVPAASERGPTGRSRER